MGDPTLVALRRRLSGDSKEYVPQPGLSLSAILLPFFSKDGEYHVILNKRTDLVEYHKGEICFPGGSRDQEDAGPHATALRETQEEMGIDLQEVEVLGALKPEATRSNFLITPVVGYISYPYTFRINTTEIAEVLEVPLSSLLDPGNLREEASQQHGEMSRAFTYAYGGHVVWGATARILTQFLSLLADFLGKETPWSTETTASRR